MRNFLTIAIISIMLVCSLTSALALDYSYSGDSKINAALALLKEKQADEVFDNLKQENVQIMFYNFSNMSFSYANHYAMKAKKGSQKYILINSKYKNSATEAIACLIVHESYHKLAKPTIDEEVLATTQEAKYWGILENKNKTYYDDQVAARLNILSALYKTSYTGNDLIRKKIASSSFYKAQLATK